VSGNFQLQEVKLSVTIANSPSSYEQAPKSPDWPISWDTSGKWSGSGSATNGRPSRTPFAWCPREWYRARGPCK